MEKKSAFSSFKKKYKNEITAYSIIGIPLLWWTVFFVIAFVWAFVVSFTDMSRGFTWDRVTLISFDNYIRIFSNTPQAKEFWSAIGVTSLWTIVMLVGNNVMGLLCAFLIKSLKRGGKVFLALLFWPSLVSAIVGADIAQTVFAPDNGGIINQIIIACGGRPVEWFLNPNTAIWALMVIPFFFGFCQKLLIYYAAIVAIPETYQEAAYLETSSRFKIFMKITLPLMRNAILLNTLLSLIDGFKVLGPMQLVTNGGPNNKTQSAMLLIYKSVFEKMRIGQGCAYAFVLFFIILAISIVQKKLSGKEETSYD